MPAIVAGWTVYAVSYVGFAFVSSPGPIWAWFGFYALFYAMTEGAERALVADLAPARLRGRAFGAFHASVGFASLPASILFGLWWKAFGPRGAFLIGAGHRRRGHRRASRLPVALGAPARRGARNRFG